MKPFMSSYPVGPVHSSSAAELGLVPTERQAQVVEASISWNYTTWLNIVFLTVAAPLVWRFLKTGGPEMHGRPYARCRSVSRLSRDGMGSADQRRTLSRSSQCYSWIYAAPTRVPRERHYAAPMILSAGHYGFTTILTGRSMLSVSSRCLRGRSSSLGLPLCWWHGVKPRAPWKPWVSLKRHELLRRRRRPAA